MSLFKSQQIRLGNENCIALPNCIKLINKESRNIESDTTDASFILVVLNIGVLFMNVFRDLKLFF
jgi:hypothetical protein